MGMRHKHVLHDKEFEVICCEKAEDDGTCTEEGCYYKDPSYSHLLDILFDIDSDKAEKKRSKLMNYCDRANLNNLDLLAAGLELLDEKRAVFYEWNDDPEEIKKPTRDLIKRCYIVFEMFVNNEAIKKIIAK